MLGDRVVVTVAVGVRENVGKSGEDDLVGKPFSKNVRVWLESFGKWSESAVLLFPSLKSSWPTHQQVPYGFKAYAILQAASEGYKKILWADSSVIALTSLTLVWEKIEKEGYLLLDNEPWNCGQWTSDRVLEMLNVERELAFTVPQVCMTVFGLNLDKLVALNFLRTYKEMADNGVFQGPWTNMNGETSSDARVLGHRHDQTAASFITYRMGLKTTPQKEILAPRISYPKAVMEVVR